MIELRCIVMVQGDNDRDHSFWKTMNSHTHTRHTHTHTYTRTYPINLQSCRWRLGAIVSYYICQRPSGNGCPTALDTPCHLQNKNGNSNIMWENMLVRCFKWFLFYLTTSNMNIRVCYLPCPLWIPVQKQFNFLALHLAIAFDRRPIIFF